MDGWFASEVREEPMLPVAAEDELRFAVTEGASGWAGGYVEAMVVE